MITETPELIDRTVTRDECREILRNLRWDRRTIHLLLNVPPKTEPFAAGPYRLTVQ